MPVHFTVLVHELVPVPFRVFVINTYVIARRSPGRNGIDTPVNEYPESGIFKPAGCPAFVQRFPGRAVALSGQSEYSRQKQKNGKGLFHGKVNACKYFRFISDSGSYQIQVHIRFTFISYSDSCSSSGFSIQFLKISSLLPDNKRPFFHSLQLIL
jgi:hypothetical protein